MSLNEAELRLADGTEAAGTYRNTEQRRSSPDMETWVTACVETLQAEGKGWYWVLRAEEESRIPAFGMNYSSRSHGLEPTLQGNFNSML